MRSSLLELHRAVTAGPLAVIALANPGTAAADTSEQFEFAEAPPEQPVVEAAVARTSSDLLLGGIAFINNLGWQLTSKQWDPLLPHDPAEETVGASLRAIPFDAPRFMYVPDAGTAQPIKPRTTWLCPDDADSVRELAARLDALQAEALDEGVAWSSSSATELRGFCANVTGTRPAIYLLDNGNLRAVWKDGAGAQIGLQFRGDGTAHYVMFAPRGGGVTARLYGSENIKNIRTQAQAAGLGYLFGA